MLPRILLALGVFWAAPTAVLGSEPAVLRLRADTWMPFNGDAEAALPGYAIEVAREIFGPQGVKVDYQTLAWSDSLVAARAGEIEAVVGANQEEAEGLVLPKQEIGAAKICLLTRRDSKWQYESVRSFRDVTVGVIEGYSYWPGLDRYLAASPAGKAGVFIAAGDGALDELMDLLDSGKIDVVVETETVLLWELRERGKKSTDYRVVYRHEPDPIFMAFAPTEAGRRYAQIFDEGLAALRESGRLKVILRQYGLSEWY